MIQYRLLELHNRNDTNLHVTGIAHASVSRLSGAFVLTGL